MTNDKLKAIIKQAIWDEDLDTLDELYDAACDNGTDEQVKMVDDAIRQIEG